MQKILIYCFLAWQASGVGGNDGSVPTPRDLREAKAVRSMEVPSSDGVYRIGVFAGTMPLPNRYVLNSASFDDFEFSSYSEISSHNYGVGTITIGKIEDIEEKLDSNEYGEEIRDFQRQNLRVRVYEAKVGQVKMQIAVFCDSETYLSIVDSNPLLWLAILEGYRPS